MIDPHIVRTTPDTVQRAATLKGCETSVQEFLAIDMQRSELLERVSKLGEEKNLAAKRQDKDQGARIKHELKEAREKLIEVEATWKKLLWSFPNIPNEATPIGKNEEENVILELVGEKTYIENPLPHWDLAALQGWIDKEKAAEVTGSRFTYLKGELVLLQQAIISFVMQQLTSGEVIERIIGEAGLEVDPTPFEPVLPPMMIRTEVYEQMGRLDPMEDKYKIEGEELYLTGSAEHTLGPIHRGEFLKKEELPKRYLGFNTAFRREAGSYGKDIRGILRMHQFDKLEMESFCLREEGEKEHAFMVAVQEYLMQQLGLQYQKVAICTGDMGTPNIQQTDLEAFMPGQGAYRETHTADYMGDYQARRLQTRYVAEEGKEYVHMNDATAFALGRALIAIMEQNQEEDGRVRIPEVLRSHLGKSHMGKAHR